MPDFDATPLDEFGDTPQFDTTGLRKLGTDDPFEAAAYRTQRSVSHPYKPHEVEPEFDATGLIPLNPPRERAGIAETAKLVGGQIADTALYHAPAGVAAALEGADPYSARDWKDYLIERSRQRAAERSAEYGKGPTSIPLIGNREDIAQLGPSAGFSVLPSVAGLASGLAAGAAGGPVAGWVAGTGAAGAAAYRQSTNQFVRDLRDTVDADRATKGERPISDDDFNTKAKELAPLINEYGLWEAIPEAAGQALGLKIVTAPVKGAIGHLFGEGIATRFGRKAAALYGAELGTEAVTQTGQHNVEVAAGTKPGEPPRDWTSLSDLGQSFQEVAPVTALQTTLFAGGAKLAGRVLPQPAQQAAPAAAPEALDGDIIPPGQPLPLAPPPAQLALPPPPQATSAPTQYGEDSTMQEAAPPRPALALPSPQMLAPEATIPGEGFYVRNPQTQPVEGRDISGQRALESMLADERTAAQIKADAQAAAVWQPTDEWQPVPRDVDLQRFPDVRLRETAQGMFARLAPTPGTRDAPVSIETSADVNLGADLTAVPTPAQADAGNYQKRHVAWRGLKGAIETEAGQQRTGVGPDGTPWSVTMPVPYGYVKGTKASDGDGVDVFFGPDPQADPVFVIDQRDPGSLRYDEAKIMAGFPDEASARQAYAASFADGRGLDRIGAITPMATPQLKRWLNSPGVRKPLAYKDLDTLGQSKPTKGRGPLDLFQFIASNGGLRDQGGELRALGLTQAVVPGFGRLVRANGRSLDSAREIAAEAGYFPGDRDVAMAGTTPAGLLDMLESQARGQAVYAQADIPEVQKLAAASQAKEAERELKEARSDVVKVVAETSAKVTEQEIDAAVELVINERFSPLEALTEVMDRASIVFWDQEEQIASHEETNVDIPGWDQAEPVAASAAEGGGRVAPPIEQVAEPRQAQGGATAGVEPGENEPGTGGGIREAARQLEDSVRRLTEASAAGVQRLTEATAAGEQGVLPGAERIGQAEQAQRAADTPLRPEAPQKPADIGLFSDESQQTDLVDMVRTAERQAPPAVEASADEPVEAEPAAAEPSTPTAIPMTEAEAKAALEKWRAVYHNFKRRLDGVERRLEGIRPTPRNALDKERIDKSYDVSERIARSLRRKVADALDAMDDARKALKQAEVKPAPKREPAAPARQKITGFETALGSTYAVHEDGTTSRDKAARNIPGHEGDSGPKKRSALTVYVDSKQAPELSAAGLQGLGEKGARVVIKDGKASLVTWNRKAEAWGRSKGGSDIPVSNILEIGKSPLELWNKTNEFPGYESYANMHAGNAITEVFRTERPPNTAPSPEELAIPDFLKRGEKAKPAAVPQAKPAQISDFGEKIEGARKDAVRDFVKALTDDVDIATEPLSKIFPQPDYPALAKSGIDGKTLAMVALIREQIPNKPQKNYRKTQWVAQVRMLRGFAEKLLSSDDNTDVFAKMRSEMPSWNNMANTADVIAGVEPEKLPFAANWSIHYAEVAVLRGVRQSPPKAMYIVHDNNDRWTNIDAETLDGVRQPMLDAIKTAYEKEEESHTGRRTPLSIYRDRFTKEIYIGFKGLTGAIRLKAGFDGVKDAREYIANNADELQSQIDSMREGPNLRRAANRERIGTTRREGDVTPEQFQEAFGFRGVQFGNYVEGDRRQSDLNESFDALMDLSNILGIPPRSLSLDGQLGLAFGARGSGGKNAPAAHYEPDKVVINLTKRGGPGSLAHEWLHALDNYFSKQDVGSKGSSPTYISATKSTLPGKARPEIFQAWNEVTKSISKGDFSERSLELDKARTKAYFSTTIEKAARAFEKYIVDRMATQQTANDYLSNIDESSGAYPTDKDMESGGIQQAYDNLFKTIDFREGVAGPGTAMFSRRADQLASAGGERVFVADATAHTAYGAGELKKIFSALRGELDNLGLRDVSLRVSQFIKLEQGGFSGLINGMYNSGVIHVALDSENMANTLRHEAIHALYRAGLFTKAEWAALMRQADRWIKQYKIDERYSDLSREIQMEEAVAHAFPEWAAGRLTVKDPLIVRLFQRMQQFLKALGVSLRASGFQSAEEVFQKIHSGEIGARPRQDIQEEAQAKRPSDSEAETKARTVDLSEERVNRKLEFDRLLSEQRVLIDKYVSNADEASVKRFEEIDKRLDELQAKDADIRDPMFSRRAIGDTERKLGISVANEVIADQLEARNLDRLARISRALQIGKANPTEVRVKLQDKFLRWKSVQAEIKKDTGKELPEELNVYMTESLYYGRTGQRLERIEKDHIDPIIDEIHRGGLTTEEISDFLMARHAPERNAKVINPDITYSSGMSDEDAAAIVSKALSGKNAAAYLAVERRVRALINETRKTLVDGGLIDNDTADAWDGAYKNYVPLRGFADGREVEDDTMSAYGRGYAIKGPESKKAGGRRSIADSPLAYAFLQAQQAVVRSEKARVGRAAARIVKANPLPGFWEVRKVGSKKVTDPTTGLLVAQGHLAPPNVFPFKASGQQYEIAFSGEHGENLARALKSIGDAQMNSVMRFIGTITRTLARLATSWNVDFMLPNLARDLGETFINMQEVEQKDFTRAFMKHLFRAPVGVFQGSSGIQGGKYAQVFRDFDAAGGRIRFFGLGSADDIKGNIGKALRRLDGGALNNVINTGERIMGGIEIANATVENVTRVAIFQAARDVGMSDAKAASLAREMTVNFNRKGEWGSALSALYMFSNAAIQGNTRMVYALRNKNVRRGAYALAAAGSMLTLYNMMVGGDDDDGVPLYYGVEPWKRATNMIVMYPKGFGRKGGYQSIPLPFGYSFFHTIGAKLTEVALGKEKAAKAAGEITKAVLDTFDPLGKDENMVAQFAPTMAKPVAHLTMNKNWTGRPINPESMPWNRHLPDSSRHFKSASPIIVGIAQDINALTGGTKHEPGLVDVSPGTIKYGLEFLTGGVGRFTVNSATTAWNAYQGKEWQPGNTPILRRFYGEIDTRMEKTSRYYDARQEVMNAHGREQAYKKEHDTDNLARFRREAKPEMLAHDAFTQADKKLKILRDLEEAAKHEDISEAEREIKIKGLQEKEQNEMSRALRLLNKLRVPVQ